MSWISANLAPLMFGGMVHEPALRLASRLTALVPAGLSRVFFSDSGSVAVEVALKMALQYWQNVGKRGKDKFLCFTDGYHGDTSAMFVIGEGEASPEARRLVEVARRCRDAGIAVIRDGARLGRPLFPGRSA